MATPPTYNVQHLKKKKDEIAVTFDAFDEDNPNALIGMVPGAVKDGIKRCLDPEQGGDIRWLSWNEPRLEREVNRVLTSHFNSQRNKLDAQDHSLRLSFWAEYYRVLKSRDTVMRERNFLDGVMSFYKFKDRLKIPIYVAWLISPPRDLAVSQEEILYQSMRILRDAVTSKDAIYEIKEVVTEDKDGNKVRTRTKKLNVRAVTEVRKLAEDLQNRRQGSVVQRHEIAAAMVTPPTVQKVIPEAASREDLEQEIRDLEAQTVEGEIDEGPSG